MRGRKRLRKKELRSFIVKLAMSGAAVQTSDDLWRTALGSFSEPAA